MVETRPLIHPIPSDSGEPSVRHIFSLSPSGTIDFGDGSETFEWARWPYTLKDVLTRAPVNINGATYIGIHGPGFSSIYKEY